MPTTKLPAQSRFNKLVNDISNLYVNARKAQVQFAWETGRRITEEEQNGAMHAAYGNGLLLKLSASLTKEHGPGFSESNLRKMRRFYQAHPKRSLATELDWTDYVELLPIKDESKRKNLERRILRENLHSKEIRALVRKTSVDDEPLPKEESRVVDQELLTPKRGTLYTYRIVKRPQIGTNADQGLLLDLGFGMYRRLTPRVAARFSAEQIVESAYDTSDESYSLKSSERTAKDLFTYQAVIEKVIDADTLKVRIDLGFDLEHRETLRLRDLDAPEVGTKAGDAAKTFVQSLLKEADTIVLHTTRSDKYDRYLADVFITAPSGEELFLNNLLLEKDYAERV